MFNAVIYTNIYVNDDGEEILNISITTPDQQEHEIDVSKKLFDKGQGFIPAEYFVHPSCCEHPNGCPGGSATQKFLERINNEQL
jgi:hypothetical protein